MAKICPKCGGKVEDDAVKCDNCGFTPSSAGKKKQTKKLKATVILAVCAAVIIISLGLIIKTVSSSGYKKAAENYFTAMVKCDFDLYWDSLCSLEYGGVDFENRYSVLNTGITFGLDYDAYLGVISSSIQSKTGEIKDIKVKTDNVKKLDSDKLDALYGTYAVENSSLEIKDIKAGKSFDAEITVTGENGETTIETYNLFAIKEKKKWKIFSLESDFDLASLIG